MQSIEELDILSKYVQAVDQIAFLRDTVAKKEEALTEEEFTASNLRKENKDLLSIIEALEKENANLIAHKQKSRLMKRSHQELTYIRDHLQETASQYSEKLQKKKKKYNALLTKQQDTKDVKNMYKSKMFGLQKEIVVLEKEIGTLRKETSDFLPIAIPRRKLTARIKVSPLPNKEIIE